MVGFPAIQEVCLEAHATKAQDALGMALL